MADNGALRDELLKLFKEIRDGLYNELQSGNLGYATQDPGIHRHAREMSAQLARDAKLYGFNKTELEERKKLVTEIFRAESSIFDLKKRLDQELSTKERTDLEFQMEARKQALTSARESLKLNNKTYEAVRQTSNTEKVYLDRLQKAMYFQQEAEKAAKSGNSLRRNAAMEASAALNYEAESAIKLDRTIQAQRQKQLIQQKSLALFGLGPDAVENMKLSMAAMAKSGVLAFLTLAETLIQVISYLNEIRLAAGLAASQMVQFGGITIRGLGAGLGQGVIAAPGTAAKDVAALTREYGSLNNVTSDVVGNQLKLTQVYGLGQPEAARLNRLIDYMSDRTAGAASHVISFTRALGIANHIPVAQLVEDMANNTEVFARFGERGAEAFVKAAASARQMGVSLGQLDQLQNNLLANPEQFLVGIQQLRQFGINIMDPGKLLSLANTPGATQQFAQELQRQLGGLRIENLSRIQQNMLIQTLGLPPSSLQLLTSSFRTGIKGQLQQPTPEAYTGEKMDNLLSSLGSLTEAIKQATSSLKNLGLIMLGGLGVLRVGSLIGGIGRGIGGLFGAGRLAGLMSNEAGAGAAGSSLLSSGAGFLGKALPIAGVGLMAGSQAMDILGGKSIGSVLKSHMFQDIGMALGGIIGGVTTGGAAILPGLALGGAAGTLLDSLLNSSSSSQQTPMANGETISLNTKPVEDKLETLIEMFRSGQITVNIDGRKVGSLIAQSYPRHA